MDLSLEMFRNIPSVVAYHYNAGNINWLMSSWVAVVHTAAMVGLFSMPHCHKATLLWAFLLWPIRYITLLFGCNTSLKWKHLKKLYGHNSTNISLLSSSWSLLCTVALV